MRIAFEPISYWWVAFIVGLGALAAAAWGSWRLRTIVRWKARVTFLALRAAAVAAVVLFAAGPRLKTTASEKRVAPVAIVIDSSASMDLATTGGTRLDIARGAAGRVAAAVTRAGGHWNCHDVARVRRPWGKRVPDLTLLRKGKRDTTDMAEGLATLASYFGDKGLAAAVVISDGIWVSAPAAPGLPPCFTLCVGETLPTDRVFITGLDAPAAIFPGTPVDVRTRYYSTYKETAVATVRVEELEGATSHASLRVEPGAGAFSTPLAGDAPGERFYRVNAGANAKWCAVRALARPLKVWYWEMAGDADFAFLKRALAANRAFDVTQRLDIGERPAPTRGSPPDDVDLIIIGNPRITEVDAVTAAAVERAVDNGAGLLFVLTARPVDAAALSSGPLAALFPYKAVSPTLGGGALREAGYVGAIAVAASPPSADFVWHVGVLKGTATPAWTAADGSPALVFMPYGLGRVGALSAGGLYKAQLRGGLDLRKAVAAVTLALYNYQAEPLVVSANIVEPEEVIEVVCDSPFEPTVAWTGPGGAVGAVVVSPASPSLWSGIWAAPAPGRYEITARVPAGEGIAVERVSVVAVEGLNEDAVFRARPDSLRALAESTGGEYYRENELDELAAAVVRVVELAPAIPRVRRINIWPGWLAAAVAVSGLALEWFLRRRAGLA